MQTSELSFVDRMLMLTKNIEYLKKQELELLAVIKQDDLKIKTAFKATPETTKKLYNGLVELNKKQLEDELKEVRRQLALEQEKLQKLTYESGLLSKPADIVRQTQRYRNFQIISQMIPNDLSETTSKMNKKTSIVSQAQSHDVTHNKKLVDDSAQESEETNKLISTNCIQTDGALKEFYSFVKQNSGNKYSIEVLVRNLDSGGNGCIPNTFACSAGYKFGEAHHMQFCIKGGTENQMVILSRQADGLHCIAGQAAELERERCTVKYPLPGIVVTVTSYDLHAVANGMALESSFKYDMKNHNCQKACIVGAEMMYLCRQTKDHKLANEIKNIVNEFLIGKCCCIPKNTPLLLATQQHDSTELAQIAADVSQQLEVK